MDLMMEQLKEIGIIPVVVIHDEKDAIPLAQALCDGGMLGVEVTFRTDAAEGTIRQMSETYKELLVGAGTVLTTEQVDRAVNAGAKFIVSPGLNPKVVRYCEEKGIPIIPGVATPIEIEQALELGLEVVKFFPAEPSGGLPMIQAMGAAYTKLKFMPTGGINLQNVEAYLQSDKILACGGSWMVKEQFIGEGNFEGITKMCKEARDLVKKVRPHSFL